MLQQFSFVASATVTLPAQTGHDSSSSSPDDVCGMMVLVDQLGRLVQFPVDAQGRAVPAAAYNPFEGTSQWLQHLAADDRRQAGSLCVDAPQVGVS
jgi:hypothetical protein